MAAPLYSRYRRYADREAARLPKGSHIRTLLPMWKRPDTRVYSLSERAAHEAGAWSALPPGELLRGLSLQYLPTRQVWVEWPWSPMVLGSLNRPIDGPLADVGVNHAGHDSSPVRVASLYKQTDDPAKCKGDRRDLFVDKTFPPGTIIALFVYLYPNGSFFVGPTFSAWHPTKNVDLFVEGAVLDLPVEDRAKEMSLMRDVAIGFHYGDRYGKQNPQLFKRLRDKMGVTIIGKLLSRSDGPVHNLHGTTRLQIAALMAALSAKPPKYAPVTDGRPSRDSGPSGPKRTVVEVDLFLRERKRVGDSLRASVGHAEGVKKGLHRVGAHYAYRRPEHGGDPTICPKTQFGMHDWEPIDGTKSEVCIVCGQKRWHKEAHERGDEKYGIVPPKTYNVRV